MNKKKLLVIISLFILLISPSPTLAQDEGIGPIYIVQPGENLSTIAAKFGVDINELIAVNGITDFNLISVGSELLIPGLEGLSGYLSVKPVELGESVPIIQKKYRMSLENLLKLNILTSPAEVYVGKNLILPASTFENSVSLNQVITIAENSSLFLKSVEKGMNHWSISFADRLVSYSQQLPGEHVLFHDDLLESESSIFSPFIQAIQISPLPVSQGHTTAFKIYSSKPVQVSGRFDGKELSFFIENASQMAYALDGIHALREAGLAELSLKGDFDDGETFQVDQMVLIEDGGFVKETLSVESTLVDEELNRQESALVQDILALSSNERYWSSSFRYPVDGALEDETIGFSSYFGNRRTYNNGEYFGFHGGLDFYILLNTFNIYAPAPGYIVYAGPMNIRGLTTFIDHGQGVVSGYAHQSEILVETGQFVNQGDLIGLIGKTGRVTGPHLHWDIWVNGNQVDPFDWVYNQYP